MVCLGVVKRILKYLKGGPRCCKLSMLQIQQISDNLSALNGKMPSQFSRQPRSLVELDRFKATEFRQFLLYTGPLVLKSVVSDKIWQHFMLLSVSMSILLDSNDERRNYYLNYAKRLLCHFVATAKEIYGETFTVYNVHGLTHIADDVENFNCSFTDISAFPFEFDLCFLVEDDKFSFVKEKHDGANFICDTYKVKDLPSLFTSPVDSKLINIVYLNETRPKKILKFHRFLFKRKVVCLHFKNGYALFPLLHEVERKKM